MIRYNPGLEELKGLEGVDWVGQDLQLVSNAVLSDVSALHGVDLVGRDLVVSYNPMLSTEDAEALVHAIDSIWGSTSIEGSGTGL